ncbi:hypothetical protein [Hymenobacter roseosalivarius]|uniref:hypothetical protein n=1 Tax=Hymenobacter roseosalivarius TaxID=89967 RepID=UPI00117A06DE|nr:hypothetical protein [Hymenobacter roseosalivarius]
MLYNPRRHRRKLLLPPGLLALAFLLLLGCGVIARSIGHSYRVLQIRFSPLYARNEFENRLFFSSPHAKATQWNDFEITGNSLLDWYNWQLAQRSIKLLHNAPDSAHGIRIRFRQKAKYKYVVKAFSYMNELGIRRYAFDMRVPTPTVYVIDSGVASQRQLKCTYIK